MNFKESKAIYLQIAERICDEILLGQYLEEDRIPSVREYAAIVEVNANTNTVMRSFDLEGVHVLKMFISQEGVPDKLREEDFNFVNGLNIRLAADSLLAIFTYAENMEVELKKRDIDSLFVSVFHQNVSLDSCKFHSFEIYGYGLDFTAKISRA